MILNIISLEVPQHVYRTCSIRQDSDYEYPFGGCAGGLIQARTRCRLGDDTEITPLDGKMAAGKEDKLALEWEEHSSTQHALETDQSSE